MARKRRDKEEELEVEEAQEEALDAEEPAGEPLDLDEPPDDERGADEPPEDEDEEEVDAPPRPRTPIFTIVLLILNFLAAPPFVILAFMDYTARLQWSHA